MTTNRLFLLFSMAAVILVWPLAAQETPTPQQLIDAAHRVSDLANLGPYTLSANVTIDSGDKKTIKTGRLLIVREHGRSREELDLGGIREVRFFLEGKRYIVPPQGFLLATGLLNFDRSWDPGHFIAARFNSVRSDKVEGADAWCQDCSILGFRDDRLTVPFPTGFAYNWSCTPISFLAQRASHV